MNLGQAALSGAGSLLCFAVLWHLRRRERAVTGTPLSRIRSAAQGPVVLEGTGHPRPGHVIVAPFSGRQCVWWATQVAMITKRDEKAEQSMPNPGLFERRQSVELFLLRDGTGECLVDPAFAEVEADRYDDWYGDMHDITSIRGARRYRAFGDELRYREWRIDLGQSITASGYFLTVDGYADSQQMEEATRAVLIGWKQDQAALLARFDLDRDGRLDEEEWEEVCRQARLQVMANRGAGTRLAMNTLCEPPDGGELLLSTTKRAQLALQLRFLVVTMLILGVGAGIFSAVCLFDP